MCLHISDFSQNHYSLFFSAFHVPNIALFYQVLLYSLFFHRHNLHAFYYNNDSNFQYDINLSSTSVALLLWNRKIYGFIASEVRVSVKYNCKGNRIPDSKVHGANMGSTWVLSAPDGPHAGPMNFAIWEVFGENVSRSCYVGGLGRMKKSAISIISQSPVYYKHVLSCLMLLGWA